VGVGPKKKTIVGLLVFNPLWFTVRKIFEFISIVRFGVQFINKINRIAHSSSFVASTQSNIKVTVRPDWISLRVVSLDRP
jgi:hypothetical protein